MNSTAQAAMREELSKSAAFVPEFLQPAVRRVSNAIFGTPTERLLKDIRARAAQRVATPANISGVAGPSPAQARLKQLLQRPERTVPGDFTQRVNAMSNSDLLERVNESYGNIGMNSLDLQGFFRERHTPQTPTNISGVVPGRYGGGLRFAELHPTQVHPLPIPTRG